MSAFKSALLVSGLAGGVVATEARTALQLRICWAHYARIIARWKALNSAHAASTADDVFCQNYTMGHPAALRRVFADLNWFKTKTAPRFLFSGLSGPRPAPHPQFVQSPAREPWGRLRACTHKRATSTVGYWCKNRHRRTLPHVAV